MMVRRPRVLSSMVKPLIATVIMAASAYLSYDLLALVLPSQTICCLGAIAIAVIIYGISVLLLRIITLDDCMLLPKGEKIAKLLKIR